MEKLIRIFRSKTERALLAERLTLGPVIVVVMLVLFEFFSQGLNLVRVHG